MGNIKQTFFHLFCAKTRSFNKDKFFEKSFKTSITSNKEFFSRFNNKITFKDKTILDIGCGFGGTVIYLALVGAKRVIGIELDKERIFFAKSKLNSNYREVLSKVDFVHNRELCHETFDIVLSKNSFEHYDNPGDFIYTMKKFMKKDGIMVIGFSPLWKSPYGGHITYLTKLPWAHLLFSESIIEKELKRYFKVEDITNFGQGIHGLNKMTLKRFLKIARDSGLKFDYFRTNVSTKASHKVIFTFFNLFRLLPFCREYFTQNVYSILRSVRDYKSDGNSIHI